MSRALDLLSQLGGQFAFPSWTNRPVSSALIWWIELWTSLAGWALKFRFPDWTGRPVSSISVCFFRARIPTCELYKLNSEPLALYDFEVPLLPPISQYLFNNNRVRTYNFLNSKQVWPLSCFHLWAKLLWLPSWACGQQMGSWVMGCYHEFGL